MNAGSEWPALPTTGCFVLKRSHPFRPQTPHLITAFVKRLAAVSAGVRFGKLAVGLSSSPVMA